jgi:hypothetical protein
LDRIWQDQTEADSVRVQAFEDFIYSGFFNSQPDTAIILAQKLVTA